MYSVRQEFQAKITQLSFKYPNSNAKEIARKVSSMQFVHAIFQFLEEKKRIQMQILNRRFYNAIVPNWRSEFQICLNQGQTYGKNLY